MVKNNCDSCGEYRTVRRIELGGGSGMAVCDKCLRKEIMWRKERNKTLSPSAKFRTKYKFKHGKHRRKARTPTMFTYIPKVY